MKKGSQVMNRIEILEKRNRELWAIKEQLQQENESLQVRIYELQKRLKKAEGSRHDF